MCHKARSHVVTVKDDRTRTHTYCIDRKATLGAESIELRMYMCHSKTVKSRVIHKRFPGELDATLTVESKVALLRIKNASVLIVPQVCYGSPSVTSSRACPFELPMLDGK